MKTNSGKKGEGMPVVRNPQFYFKEGYFTIIILFSCFTSGSDGMFVNLLVLSPRGARLTLFFVVIRVVNSFHKDLAIVNLVGHRTAE